MVMEFQSSMVSANCCRTIVDDRCYSSENQEESGWTVYLEDFMAADYRHDDDESTTELDEFSSSFSSGGYVVDSSSMVSDDAAGFSATWKHSGGNDKFDDCRRLRGVSSSMKRSKRRRTCARVVDHDLEDTASSPVQTSKANGHFCDQEESFKILPQLPNQAAFEGDFLGRESNYTEQQLRRKGLCLVPVSMLYSVTHHFVAATHLE